MTAGPNTHTFPAMMKDWQNRLVAVERRLARSPVIPDPYVLPDRLAADLPSIPGGTNLNTILETGWYIQRTTANATLALNYPVLRAGHLEVSNSGGVGYVLQTYTEYVSTSASTLPAREWRRTYYNGTWSPWFEIPSTPYVLPGRLERGTDITSVANCNSAVEAGWYLANNATNAPIATAGGSLMVYRATSTASNIRQEFRRVVVGDYRTWTRTSGDFGATWSAWVMTERQMEIGTVAVPAINTGTGTTLTINYTVPFAATPEVFVQMQTSARITTATLTKNTTACQIRFDNFSGGNAATSTAVWQAIDPG